MSLRDQACYTLQLQSSSTDPGVSELHEVEGIRKEVRYARVKEVKEGEVSSAAIYDYLTGAKLASTGYYSEKGKQRRLQLHGPDEDVSFEFTGKINFEWTFVFQGNKFRWNKEIYGKDYILSLDRKPDPKVEICLARSPDKNDPGRVQILHYNIERFPNEITDLRGLEMLIVTTFMSFVDAAEERASRPGLATQPGKMSPASSSTAVPPAGPSQPADKKVISEDDYEAENPNEILVGMMSNTDDHIARAIGLLLDPSVLFLIIRTREPAAAQRALEVALGVTRFRHREGLGDLHQYVVEQTETEPRPALESSKSTGVIKLDDPHPEPVKKPSKPTTALNIAVYLSTIELPDLRPDRRKTSASSSIRPDPGMALKANTISKPTNKVTGTPAKPASSLTPSRPSPPAKISNNQASPASDSTTRPSPSSGPIRPPQPALSPAAPPLPSSNRPTSPQLPASVLPRPPPPHAKEDGKDDEVDNQ